MTFRVGTYNIMNGGGDRFPGQLKAIAELDLDILGIQEAKHWDRDRFRKMNAAVAAWGMQPLFIPSGNHGCHLVLFYRWPRVQVVEHTSDIGGDFHHAASRTQLRIEGMGQTVTVLHTHLDPCSPERRLKEVGWLTEYADPEILSILIGDLNITGTDDPEPSNWDSIPAHLHSRHRFVWPDGSYGGTDRRAIRALLAAGFVDPPAQLGIPAPRTVGHWPGGERWDHRSDHVLLSSSLAPSLHAHHVVDNATTQELSDHMPTLAELHLWRL